jgi:hypothetical protein
LDRTFYAILFIAVAVRILPLAVIVIVGTLVAFDTPVASELPFAAPDTAVSTTPVAVA